MRVYFAARDAANSSWTEGAYGWAIGHELLATAVLPWSLVTQAAHDVFAIPGQVHENLLQAGVSPNTLDAIEASPMLAPELSLLEVGPALDSALVGLSKAISPGKLIDPLAGAINLNSDAAVSRFGLYKIHIQADTEEVLFKIGKADLKRVTKSSGLPTRLHQQVRKLRNIHGEENVRGEVFKDLGETTTKEAKAAEEAEIRSYYEETGKVPEGNKKSFKP